MVRDYFKEIVLKDYAFKPEILTSEQKQLEGRRARQRFYTKVRYCHVFSLKRFDWTNPTSMLRKIQSEQGNINWSLKKSSAESPAKNVLTVTSVSNRLSAVNGHFKVARNSFLARVAWAVEHYH